jgi:hypothetical protein
VLFTVGAFARRDQYNYYLQILSQISAHPSPLASCAPSRYGSTLVQIPSPGPENDDRNPPRIQSRNLFDVAIGEDVLFHGTRYKWSLRVSVINLMNKLALYNFLSTFSGPHYVTPRTMTAEIGFTSNATTLAGPTFVPRSLPATRSRPGRRLRTRLRSRAFSVQDPSGKRSRPCPR